MPNIKTVTALTNCHVAKSIYHSKESVINWAPNASAGLRKVAKQWRDMAVYQDKLDTCLRKAWGVHNKNRVGHLRTMSSRGQTIKTLGVNRLEELWDFRVLGYRTLGL